MQLRIPGFIRFIWFVVCALAFLNAQDRAIDVQRSTITIHVGKAGLFSIAGHEHWVEAPISSGVISDSTPAHVEFRVDPAKMEVKPDPKVEAKTQAEIQKDMQEKTLESTKYPEIVFRSTRVEKQGPRQWRVEGLLSLHGMSNQISVLVARSDNAYTGHTTLRQTDFGIKPVTAAGGNVKVKNELQLEFRFFASTH